MNYIIRSVTARLLAFIAVTLVVVTSCTKMDDYKKYLGDSEITYTGKADSVVVYSGKDRVLVKALLVSDPTIKTVKIYWDSRADSVIIPVTRTSGVDTLKTYINNLAEGSHTFEVVTADQYGNKSVSAFKTGTVYGTRYEASLINRPIVSSALNADLQTTLTFADMDLTSGVFATQIKYLKETGDSATIMLPIADIDTALLQHKFGSKLIYRTLYLPDTLSIDAFYSPYTTYQPVSGATWIDQTKKLVKNAGNPFLPVTSVSRWGILADWITNDDVKNASGNGGYELRSGAGVLSMEGGWGLPAVPNGKIYQVVNLPYAGKWRFTALLSDLGTAGTKYLVVNKAGTVPDFTNITSANNYTDFSTMAGGATATVEFTATAASSVAIGFVASMPNTGSYFKVKSVGLSFYKE